ncbi:two component transcriptional regulator, LuxR family [Kosakonia oryziphila]|jgi:two component transcriptional regulator, LuxR family|uniref:Two component transcriptional regulator, LuxR family n=2 Tax=Kosakonia oryziphila TaxID=1005667 RepID=A0A1C4GGZ2_9ENTR|nr:two component transcriptional regulator, LuxR family [Kosakonia oryziphila]
MMEPVVYVVDDDNAVRKALVRLLASEGYRAIDFASAESFLSHPLVGVPACLILDLNMPGVNGFDVASALKDRGRELPIIFLTGFGTIPLTVQAMKAGAREFLTKPVEPEQLLAAVADALKGAEQEFEQQQANFALKQRHLSLTPREQEVFELAISGLLNKQIAAELGVSEITVKVHRRRVMDKMQARSLADLVHAAGSLQIAKSRSR